MKYFTDTHVAQRMNHNDLADPQILMPGVTHQVKYLLNGLTQNFVQTFMGPRQCILMTSNL